MRIRYKVSPRVGQTWRAREVGRKYGEELCEKPEKKRREEEKVDDVNSDEHVSLGVLKRQWVETSVVVILKRKTWCQRGAENRGRRELTVRRQN